MGLLTIRVEDVPQYLQQSDFFLALNDGGDGEFSVCSTHFKTDTIITDEDSLRDLLCTLRFWGAENIPYSLYEIAFDQDCLFFTSVASEFRAELRYLEELIHLRSLPIEKRLENACRIGNLELLRGIIGNRSVAINRIFLEAAASGGYLNCIQYLHSFRGRRHWSRICDAAASKGHLPCVEYVFTHTKAFFDAAHSAAAHGHTNILRFIARHNGTLKKELYEACLPNLEVVKCLYDLNVPRWPHGYAHNLVMWNVLPVLRFALAHGCPIYDLILRSARSAECVQILIEVGGYELNERSIVHAAQAGLEVLKYVHSLGYPLTIQAAILASQQNKLDVLRYLHEQGCPWNAHCFHEAEMQGSYECLVYMYSQGITIPHFYREYFLKPNDFDVSHQRRDSKCMNYLRSQFDCKKKCFIGRNIHGDVFANDSAGMEEIDRASASRLCVIQ